MSDLNKFILTILKQIATQSFSPTYTSRILYVFSTLVYHTQQSYQYELKSLTGSSITFQSTWPPNRHTQIVLYAAKWSLNKLNQDFFNQSVFVQTFLNQFISLQESDYTQLLISHSTEITRLTTELQAYYTLLDADGWKNTITISLPNGTSRIDPNAVLPSLIEPSKWTPLINQNFLTPHWGNIQGPLTSVQKEIYKTQFNTFFETSTNLDSEYTSLFYLTQTMEDQEKVIAEFWAGGPGTVTPPGYWCLFASIYWSNQPVLLEKELLTYYLLNAATFQMGILAWEQKLLHFQERPIQAIRRLIPEGSLWKPHQPSTFQTPPFPDFVSGHSSFSAAASVILSRVLGSNLLNMDLHFDGSLLYLMSPLFNIKYQSKPDLTNLMVYPNTSEIQANIPATWISLSFHSWDEMALQAGKSRIYGGIHIDSSNYPGYLVGKDVANYLYELIQ